MGKRAVTEADLPALVDVARRCELGDEERKPVTESTLRAALTAPKVDRARDLQLWTGADGEVLAFARLRIEAAEGETQARLVYVVASRQEVALEASILRWAARRFVEAAPAPRRLIHAVGEHDSERGTRLTEHGFELLRLRNEMARSSAMPVAEVPLPSGFRIRSCAGPADAEAYVDTFNEAFSDVHDATKLTLESYLHDLADPAYAAEHDLVVEDPAGAIAGLCFSMIEAPETGEAYVCALAVRRAHRRRGLGAALLAHALRTLHAEGAVNVNLRVDSDSAIGAPRLYERMGFSTLSVERRYAIGDDVLAALAR